MSNTATAPQMAPQTSQRPTLASFEYDEFRVIHQADIMRGEVMAKLFIKLTAAIKTVFHRAIRAVEQAQTMRALASLDDRALADIGLTRSDIPSLCLRDTKPATVAVVEETAEIETRRAA